MLGADFENLAVLNAEELMRQSDRDVQCVVFSHDDRRLLSRIAVFPDAHLDNAVKDAERLILYLMIVDAAFLPLVHFKDLAAVQFVVRNPQFSPPTLGMDVGVCYRGHSSR